MTHRARLAADLFKALSRFTSLRFPPTRFAPIFSRRGGLSAQGQGHNATTVKNPSVVGSVVGYLRWISTLYPPPTTPQRQNPDIYMYMCAPVRTQGIVPLWALWRCGFIYLFDNIKEKYSKGHNESHNAKFLIVVGWSKSLENLNKGGFCRG